jgi:hypothetical protein
VPRFSNGKRLKILLKLFVQEEQGFVATISTALLFGGRVGTGELALSYVSIQI